VPENKILRAEWLIIPLVFLACAFYLGYFAHDVFEEFDGVMQLYAGREIVQGAGYNGWPSHFWPPLYPLLVGVLDLFMSGFNAAKTVSIISGFLLLVVVYFFSFEIYGAKKLALLSQVFVVINPLFFISSIQAENHMLDALFFCLSVLFVLHSKKQNKLYFFFLIGLSVGIACLSRYTSYILLPVIVFFVLYSYDEKIKKILLFVLGVSLICSPWWIYNYVENGSPFYTWQYLNVGSGVYSGGFAEWWYQAQDGFYSVADILVYYPREYVINIITNIIASVIIVFLSSSALGFVLMPAILRAFNQNDRYVMVFLSLLFVGFVLLVSQAFVFSQVFLAWSVIATIFAVEYIYDFKRVSGAGLLGGFQVGKVLVMLFFVLSSVYSAYKINAYIGDKSDGGQLSELEKVIAAMKEYDGNIEQKCIMSRHPGRAYYLNSRWVNAPLFYSGQVGNLVRYHNVSEKIKESVARIPVKNDGAFPEVNYFVYDKGLMEHLPEFLYLMDVKDERIPSTFFPVYHSGEVVVYHIKSEK